MSIKTSYAIIKQEHQKLYNLHSAEYEQRTKNAYHKYLKPFVDSFLDQLKNKNILDLGCGPGRDLLYFLSKGYNAVGVDLSPEMVAICKQKGVTAVQTDFLELPFENNYFGGIWAYTSLTLLPKKEFLEAIERVSNLLIKNGGIFALGMIEGGYEGWKTDHKYPGYNRFILRVSANELHNILKKHFDTVDVQRVLDPENQNRVYLHAICRHSSISNSPQQAARRLFNEYAKTYESRTLSGIKLLEKDRQYFLSNIRPGGSILDLGSGPGRDSELFKSMGFHPIAFDISEENIRICKEKNIETIIGDIYKIRDFLKESSVDAIWANCSVTNWLQADKIAGTIKQIIPIVKKPGIIFIGSVLGNFSGWEISEKYNQMPRYNNHWDIQELKDLFIKAGLNKIIYERLISQEESKRKPYLNLIYKVE